MIRERIRRQEVLLPTNENQEKIVDVFITKTTVNLAKCETFCQLAQA